MELQNSYIQAYTHKRNKREKQPKIQKENQIKIGKRERREEISIKLGQVLSTTKLSRKYITYENSTHVVSDTPHPLCSAAPELASTPNRSP